MRPRLPTNTQSNSSTYACDKLEAIHLESRLLDKIREHDYQDHREDHSSRARLDPAAFAVYPAAAGNQQYHQSLPSAPGDNPTTRA